MDQPRRNLRSRTLGSASALALLAATLTACGAFACGGAGKAAPSELAFDEARAWKLLVEQVELGPRPAGSPALESARLILERELRAYGLEPKRETFTPETPAGPIEMTNVYADLEAPARDGKPAPMVVICTHFETKRMKFPFVGANDSASGTAALLELARVLSAPGASKSRSVTLRFLFLDGEEAIREHWQDPDNRYGSRQHVAGLVKRGEIKRVKACVLLDLVGDKDFKLTRDEYSDRPLIDAFYDAARKAGLEQYVDGPSQAVKDDHQSFLEAGVPSVDLIDLDYDAWHTEQDKLDQVSAASLGVIGRIVLLGLPEVERFALR